MLPGDISFNAVHRADCYQTSVFAMYRVGREEKSRVNNMYYVGNISNNFNIIEICEFLNYVILDIVIIIHLMNSHVWPLSACIILFYEELITE